MKFIVSEKVFDALEDVCFGVVIAKGVDNRGNNTSVNELLKTSIGYIEGKFLDKKVKECEEILPYREAFKKIGINPNQNMSSIEAMASRIAKKKGFPNINTIVDLGNAVSLKYLVPLGAHDMESASEDIYVRFSEEGDLFVPFGETEAETLKEGELIYSVGDKVKTRRWIWRQSEEGKITEESKNIFFPIDGFKDKNYNSVIGARDELAKLLKEILNCEVNVGFVDRDNRELEL